MLWFVDGSGGESHSRRSRRNRFPIRMLEHACLISIRFGNHERSDRTAAIVLSCKSTTILVTLSSTTDTSWISLLALSSTVLVTFKTCAAATRASSCVSQSNLFSASLIWVLPISFFRYFSEKGSVNGYVFAQLRLTRSSLSDLFRCNSKKVDDFNQYFYDNIHHFLVDCRFNIELKSS